MVTSEGARLFLGTTNIELASDVKHVIFCLMKTITIRDLRQRWPEAEAALRIESQILITRDSKPVAMLVPVPLAVSRRPRWNMKAHARWQKKISGGMLPRSEVALAQSRADRELIGKLK
jgi:antitoxin (DNA-binding transcriptional repressor) of toxin-antitoxin stability system